MIEKQCERPGCPNTFFIDETHVGKKRQYCSDNCRQIIHRREKERKEREVKEKHIAKLREIWRQFSPEVQEKLEEVMQYSSNWTAQTATDALILLKDEMKALARAKYTEGYEAGRSEVSQV